MFIPAKALLPLQASRKKNHHTGEYQPCTNKKASHGYILYTITCRGSVGPSAFPKPQLDKHFDMRCLGKEVKDRYILNHVGIGQLSQIPRQG